MPKIYELPASIGAATLGAGISPDRPPRIIRDEPIGAQPQRSTWATTKPMQMSLQMLEDQMKTGQRSVTRWFDAQAAILSEQHLDSDKYKTEYGRLQRQATTKYAEVRAKAEAQANHIESLRKLVEAGTFTDKQMEQAMLVMAGHSAEHVRATYAQYKQQKPMARMKDLKYQAERIEAFRDRFVDDRTDIFGKGLWRKNPKTEKRTDIRAKEEERQAYDDAGTQLYNIQMEMTGLFDELSPLEKTAQAGSRAVERFGKGHIPPLAAQRAFDALDIGGRFITKPTPVSEGQPTEREFHKTIKDLKAAGSIKKAKAYYNKWVKKIWQE